MNLGDFKIFSQDYKVALICCEGNFFTLKNMDLSKVQTTDISQIIVVCVFYELLVDVYHLAKH